MNAIAIKKIRKLNFRYSAMYLSKKLVAGLPGIFFFNMAFYYYFENLVLIFNSTILAKA